MWGPGTYTVHLTYMQHNTHANKVKINISFLKREREILRIFPMTKLKEVKLVSGLLTRYYFFPSSLYFLLINTDFDQN